MNIARCLTSSIVAILVCSSAPVHGQDVVKPPPRVPEQEKPSTSQAVPVTPAAPPSAAPACQKQPRGCTTAFTPVADSLAPEWYAKQEKTAEEARRHKAKAEAYLAKYQAHARKRGWELNDVARAYAFFVSLVYNVYSSGQGPDRAQLEVLTKRFRKELANDPKFQANGDRERQFIYERLILIALDNEAALVHSRQEENPAREQEHRKRAKAWLEDVLERPVEQIPELWRQ
jgi:hypothetical protein